VKRRKTEHKLIYKLTQESEKCISTPLELHCGENLKIVQMYCVHRIGVIVSKVLSHRPTKNKQLL